jgi:2-polyprenyl-6-methoxyphenol hydroxylase-like FAD-dependent oxidoreductase
MTLDAPVVIAGAGPVGMTLALELARHGVRSILVERNHDTTRHPKMDLTNGRSMELYRRLGLADKLRAVGVPEQNRFDIMWATSPSGHILHTFRYDPANAVREAMTRANDGTGTAEPGMRISQIVLEPVLRAAIEANPLIDSLFGWKVDALRQDEASVRVAIRSADSDERQELHCHYLAGCDGGGSRVRRTLGIGLEGPQNIARILMIHFKSKDRDILNPWGIAWHLQTAAGNLVAQDDVDTWTVHVPLPPGTDESALDPGQVLRQFVGRDFDFRILVSNPWGPNQVVADRYIENRVILAGDAAHQVIPTGGYGMNSGVGDAVDLGWKLAAMVNGWGGPGLLPSYESERRPIALQNRKASEAHFAVRMKIAEAFAAAQARGPIDEPGAAGDDRRQELGARIAALGNAENECWGIEHGYRYGNSPIVHNEAGMAPPFDPLHGTPTTFPGARLPHVVLKDGTALIDRLGVAFSLLVIGEANAGGFPSAATKLGIPLTIISLPYEPKLALLERALILVRPDQHVSWRGDVPLANPTSILLHATGRSQ